MIEAAKRKKLKKEDHQLEMILRPGTWDDYIGQERIKNNLKIMLQAAKKRSELPEHLLFYGPQGLGKTTLAHLIAKEIGAGLRVASGVNLEKSGDLVAVLANLEENEVLFIDEAHRLNRMIEEILYPAMESRKVYITVGKGPAARMMSLDIPPFTLIAATTRLNLLSSPLRARFGAILGVEYYEIEEIKKIILRSAEILNVKIEEEAAQIIAKASRFTPRTANRLLKRVRDFVQVKNIGTINKDAVERTLKMLEIDEMGLEKWDKKLLEAIIKRYAGGPVGLNTLAAVLGEDKGIIEEVYEPFLIKLGLLQKTSSGRIATPQAYKHLRKN